MIMLTGYHLTHILYHDNHITLYRGQRTQDNLPVLVRFLRQEYPAPHAIAKLRQEYEIFKEIQLTRALKPLALEKYQHSPALILQDNEGVLLSQAIRESQLNIKEKLEIAIALTEVLAELHQKQWLHHHFEPAQLLVHPATGQTKLISLSHAKPLLPDNTNFSIPTEFNLAYLSPEQTGRMNRGIDHRSDFYTLGITLYELFTGNPPFNSDDPMELIHAHIAKTPIPPYQQDAQIPLPISDIILKLLAKSPEARYRTHYGIQQDLEECLQQLEQKQLVTSFTLGQQDVAGQLEIPVQLYEREAILEQLMQTYQAAQAGWSGCILIKGEQGIGKTSILRALQNRLTNTADSILFAECKANEINHNPLINAIREWLRQQLSGTETALNQLRQLLLIKLSNEINILREWLPELALIVKNTLPINLSGIDKNSVLFKSFKMLLNILSTFHPPLLICLDNLSHANEATKALLIYCLQPPRIPHCLIIATLSNTHAHTLALPSDTLCTTLTLEPLHPDSIAQLLATLFKTSAATTQFLALIVQGKTAGNPFFIKEFLNKLYQNQYITYNHAQHRWQWLLEKVQQAEVTENVADTLITRIPTIDPNILPALQIAATIGKQFEMDTVKHVWRRWQKKPFPNDQESMWQFVENGLITPLEEINTTHYYQFLHPRVQQATYHTLTNTEQNLIHYHIGQLWVEQTPFEELREKLARVLYHLNLGKESIQNTNQRYDLIKFNMAAGKKAKDAGNIAQAKHYFDNCLSLLPPDAWQKNYILTLALHVESVETTYFYDDFSKAEALANTVLEQSHTTLEIVRVYEAQIQFYILRNQLMHAVEIALIVLKKLDIPLCETPPTKNINELNRLPEMNHPPALAALRILAAVAPATYMTNSQLYATIIYTALDLCSQYGNTSYAAFAYASYGALLCADLGDIERGTQAGILATTLLPNTNKSRLRGRVQYILNAHIRLWKEPIRTTLKSLKDNIQFNLTNGELQYACLSALMYCDHLFFTGEPLTTVSQEQTRYAEMMQRFEQTPYSHYLNLWQNTITCLQQRHQTPPNIETERLPQLLASNNYTALFVYHLQRCLIAYLFKDYDQAITLANTASTYTTSARGMIHTAQLNFYHSLILLGLAQQAEPFEQTQYLQKVQENQRTMRHWANHAPSNYLHKYDLIEAEKARVLHQYLTAIEYYDRAIQNAQQHEYLHEEALANELAGAFYYRWGRHKIAQTYLREAAFAYTHWGSVAKVAMLENTYADIFATWHKANATETGMLSAALSVANNLDVMAVLKASQTLSGEIVLERLIEKMLRVVLESAGAERGALLLEQQGEWFIEAQGAIDEKIQVLQSIPLRQYEYATPKTDTPRPPLPLAIVNYTLRTQKPLMLTEASRDDRFNNDPYVIQHHPKSVLALPISSKARLTGMVYLENNLMTGAFTTEHLTVLQLLATQIAISIENAIVYKQLEKDIQERKRMESELRQKEEFLRLVLDNIPQYIFWKSVEGVYQGCNLALAHLTQLSSPLEIIGKTDFDLIWKEDAMALHQLDRQVIEKNTAIYNYIEKIMLGDGRFHWLETNRIPLHDTSGRVVGLLGSSSDITERKQAEEVLHEYNQTLEREVAQRTRALAESEERFNLAMQGSSDGLWDWQIGTNQMYFSPRWKEILGYKDDELPNHPDTFIHSMYPDELVEVMNKLEDYWDKKQSIFESINRQKHRDGHYVWVRNRGIAVWDNKHDRPYRMVGTMVDISAQKAAEDYLRQAKEAADAANHAKSEFLASMSHELRTPLNGILGYAQILMRDEDLKEKQREGVHIIQRSGEHLLTLINDILDLSKIEAGKFEIESHDFRFPEFLKDIADLMSMRAQQKNLTFNYIPLSHLPRAVHADEKRLRQILLNLLSNAIKFTPKGKVEFRVGYDHNQIRFEVEDTGNGIPPNYLESIFLPFQQVGNQRHQIEGTGLGLSISRKLVNMMGGQLQVKSTVGVGSVFWFAILLPEAYGFIDLKTQQQPQITGYRGKHLTILVVDDKSENRSLLAYLLEPLGFDIISAENGEVALQQMEQQLPDLIITDLLMPVLDGFELARRIREKTAWQHIPIIAASASAFESHQNESFNAGCNSFLAKPIRLEILLELIKTHLSIEWEYAGEKSEMIDITPVSMDTLLHGPTSEEAAHLCNLLMMGDIQAIINQVNYLETHNPALHDFAQITRQLAKNFKEQQLEILFQRYA